MSDADPFDLGHLEPALTSVDSQLAQATEESDVRWLVTEPRGRRIARGLLERSGVWRSTFTGDALTSAFREGERNVGLGLLALVQRHAPEQVGAILTKDGYEPRHDHD